MFISVLSSNSNSDVGSLPFKKRKRVCVHKLNSLLYFKQWFVQSMMKIVCHLKLPFYLNFQKKMYKPDHGRLSANLISSIYSFHIYLLGLILCDPFIHSHLRQIFSVSDRKDCAPILLNVICLCYTYTG